MEMFFDGKSSLTHFGLDLRECCVSPPVRKRFSIDVPGADGTIDLMRGMGSPLYENRTVTASFVAADANVRAAVDRLLAELEGQTVPIVLPDDADHYMTGEAHISGAGCQPGAKVTITVTCGPWRYAAEEVVHQIPASDDEVKYTWANTGTREAVPEVTVEDELRIVLGDTSMALSAGTYLLTVLTIPGRGSITVTVSGGAATVRYREAVL